MAQNYQWTPSQDEVVYSSSTTSETIPRGLIRQTAWGNLAQNPPEGRPPDIQGVYIEPIPPAAPVWRSIVWRWADTRRRDSIQRAVTAGNPPAGGFPAYRIGLTQADKASPGTSGNHPRAELLSVDPEEKRRGRQPSASTLGWFGNGDEYWATFAIFVPNNFPTTHDWATLFQRKLDDRFFAQGNFCTWLTINVHQAQVDVSAPGYSSWQTQPAAKKICNLGDITGQWAQFVVYERLVNVNGGLAPGAAEVTLKRVGHADIQITVMPTAPGGTTKTFPAGDVKGFFQYGYYRENDPLPNTAPPGTGILYYTPLLFSKTKAAIPQLP